MVRGGIGTAHQLLRNASSMPGLSILPTGHTGTPCASMLRQQVHGVIHKSPGRPSLEASLHAGVRPSCVGSEQGDASSPPKITLTAQSFLPEARMPWTMNGPAFHSMLFPQSLCYRRYSDESGNDGTSFF